LFYQPAEIVHHAASSLRRVELDAYAEIIEGALKRCDVSSTSNILGQVVNSFEPSDEFGDEPFADLETRFFTLYHANEGEFRTKMLQFIIKNEKEFTGQDQ
jgi:hypothetical protein